MYQTPFYNINSFVKLQRPQDLQRAKSREEFINFDIMKIEGKDGMHYNVSSQAQGGTALGLGIAGTALGLMNNNGCGNGLFGLFGGNNNNGNCYISEKEFQWAQAYNTKQSEVDMLKSDQRTDGKLLELYREIDRRFTATGQEIATLAAGQAVINQKVTDNIAFTNAKIDNEIAAVRCWVAANYVPGKLVMPLDSICPAAAPLCTEGK